MFVPDKPFRPSLIFAMKEGGFPRGRLLLLPAKIQSEKLPGTNALATASVAKSFKYYCIEGIEMRQLAFRSADVYCQNLNNLKCTLALFLYANGKKGKQASNKRDRERECARV